jgi:hypothetical protein
MLDCSNPSSKILSTNNFIVPCIANLLDSIHRFVQNLHKICYFMGLCVSAHRYFVFKTHMMHVIENISSYLYMHHNVLDAQIHVQKTQTHEKFFCMISIIKLWDWKLVMCHSMYSTKQFISPYPLI